MKRIMLLLMTGITLQLTACAAYMVQTEQPLNASFKEHKTVVCDWLDLKEADFKKYYYDNQKEWADTIQAVNLKGLRKYLKDELADKKIIFLDANAEPTENNGLLIKFNVDKISPEWNGFTGGTDKLHLDMEFVDLKTKKSLYKTKLIVTSKGPYATQTGFQNRLIRTTMHLADFIATKFK